MFLNLACVCVCERECCSTTFATRRCVFFYKAVSSFVHFRGVPLNGEASLWSIRVFGHTCTLLLFNFILCGFFMRLLSGSMLG